MHAKLSVIFTAEQLKNKKIFFQKQTIKTSESIHCDLFTYIGAGLNSLVIRSLQKCAQVCRVHFFNDNI